MSIEKLILDAAFMGITEMALTDINNSTGIMEFMRECKEHDIKPIGGIEFRKQNRLLYIGIARDKEGMKELNDFLTLHNMTQKELPEQAIAFKHVYVIYPYQSGYIPVRENEFVGIRPDQLNYLYGKELEPLKHKLLTWFPVTVYNRLQYRLHQYLRAIDLNTVLTKVADADKCMPAEQFMPPLELEKMYAAYPFIVDNTRQLMANCKLDYKGKERRNKANFGSSREADRLLLEQLAWAGMKDRYAADNQEAIDRVQKELDVIDELNFYAYFLITWDVIQYSKSKGYYHVGRGSGANSIVAFCLRITDVDPLELDLYFERFLNKHRSSPPDFDIDFSWDEREDIQRYIFDTYGSVHTAMLGTMSTFKDRSVIREIGKVMGLPKEEIETFIDPVKEEENKKKPGL